MRWLVTGAAGMLGRDLVRTLEAAGEQVHGATHAELDVADAEAVAQTVAELRPDIVANCAAWTDVDGAEDAEDRVRRVNVAGPTNLATACGSFGARLLQMSTDYVFDGGAGTPYTEDSPVAPVNAYGRAASAAERAIRETLPGAGYVVRTAWLYGEHGSNFVKTMLRFEAERDTVDVVDDQVGQPTWTVDVAHQLLQLGRSTATPGIYHATSSGQTTWHGFAREIFRCAGADPHRVRPTTSAAFARPARRPAFSALSHDGWSAAGIRPLGPWDERLHEAFPRILAEVRS